MICYKDMTFCRATCATKECSRMMTDEVRSGARAWWGHDPDNAPIATSDFSDTCEYYRYEVTE